MVWRVGVIILIFSADNQIIKQPGPKMGSEVGWPRADFAINLSASAWQGFRQSVDRFGAGQELGSRASAAQTSWVPPPFSVAKPKRPPDYRVRCGRKRSAPPPRNRHARVLRPAPPTAFRRVFAPPHQIQRL